MATARNQKPNFSRAVEEALGAELAPSFFSDDQLAEIKRRLSGYSEAELDNAVPEAEANIYWNPDVAIAKRGGAAYMMGTKGGRAKYEEDKRMFTGRLGLLAELVAGEKAARSKAGAEARRTEMPVQGPFEVRDDPAEEGLSTSEIMDERIASEVNQPPSDIAQIQSLEGGISPERVGAALEARDKATEISTARKASLDAARASSEPADIEEEVVSISAPAPALTAGGGEPQGTYSRTGSSPARKVIEEEVVGAPDSQLLADFQVTHGGPFDPKSRMDAAKMGQLVEARAKYPDATPTQLALKIYRGEFD